MSRSAFQIKCSDAVGVGEPIPQDVGAIVDIISEAAFVVVVEKDATFQRLLDEDALNALHPVILGECYMLSTASSIIDIFHFSDWQRSAGLKHAAIRASPMAYVGRPRAGPRGRRPFRCGNHVYLPIRFPGHCLVGRVHGRAGHALARRASLGLRLHSRGETDAVERRGQTEIEVKDTRSSRRVSVYSGR